MGIRKTCSSSKTVIQCTNSRIMHVSIHKVHANIHVETMAILLCIIALCNNIYVHDAQPTQLQIDHWAEGIV